MAELDSILSEHRASAPASDTPTNEPAQQEATPQAAPDGPKPEGQQPEGDEAEGVVDVGGQRMVPHQALHAEKQKVKRYTEQVADFERKLEAQQTEMRRFQQSLLERLTPQQQAQQPEPPDFFADPNAAAAQIAQQMVQQALGPIAQRVTQSTESMSRRFAVQEHGKESVDAAYAAMEGAFQSGDQRTIAEYQRIMASGDPWGELVQWNKRQEILRDPDAYRAKIEAEVLAKIQQNGGTQQQGQATNGQAGAPVMPSNFAAARNVGARTGPAWSGPTPLNDIFKR